MVIVLLQSTAPLRAQDTLSTGSLFINNDFGFSIFMPGKVWTKADTGMFGKAYVYCNPLESVCMVATWRKSRFQRVEEYMDCSRADLEKELRVMNEDTSLQVLACYKPGESGNESSLLQYKTVTGPFGLNGCMLYFFHHGDEDVQLSFLYNAEESKKSTAYILACMRSFYFTDNAK